jgi:MIP family channel proteins
MIGALIGVSGAHFNPAVTLALLARRRIVSGTAVAYVAAQVAGGVAAALVVEALYPARFDRVLESSVPAINDGSGFSASTGLALEALLTFFLVWVVFAVAVDGEKTIVPLAAFAIGLVVTVDILVGASITGAAMNPARVFGPQLVFGVWDDAWIYYVGPPLGALVAAAVSAWLLAGRPRPLTEPSGG